jgi:hypothetical protein
MFRLCQEKYQTVLSSPILVDPLSARSVWYLVSSVWKRLKNPVFPEKTVLGFDIPGTGSWCPGSGPVFGKALPFGSS